MCNDAGAAKLRRGLHLREATEATPLRPLRSGAGFANCQERYVVTVRSRGSARRRLVRYPR